MRKVLSLIFAVAAFMASCSDDLTEGDGNPNGDPFEDVPEAYVLTASTKAASRLPGYGQPWSHFKIRNAAELKYFVEAVNSGTLHPYAHEPENEDDKNWQESGPVYVDLAHDIEVAEDYGWTPIGTYSNPFEAQFDGSGYAIKGTLNHRDIRVEADTLHHSGTGLRVAKYGFIGFARTGRISGLTVSADIKASKFEPYTSVGGVAAVAGDAEFVNCTFSGSIRNVAGASMEEFYVGGLFGICGYAEVEGCKSEGVFKLDESLKTSNTTFHAAKLYVGGLAGYCRGPQFSGCENRTAITLDHIITAQAFVGGLFGRAEEDAPFSLLEVTNAGAVKVSNVRRIVADLPDQGVYVGGIVGNGFLRGNVGKTANRGEITVRSTTLPAYVGGVGGNVWVSNPDFIDVANEADVANNSHEGYTGGCFGRYEGEAFSAINSGNVSSTCERSADLVESGSTGGIVGMASRYNRAVLANVRNAGDVTSPEPFETSHGLQSYAGSIVGNAAPVYDGGCVNTGKVNGILPEDPRVSMVGALWLGWQRLLDGDMDFYESEEGNYWREQLKAYIVHSM